MRVNPKCAHQVEEMSLLTTFRRPVVGMQRLVVVIACLREL
jgi:hypothetical protein